MGCSWPGAALLVWLVAKKRAAAFGWSWIYLNLLPVLNFIPSNTIFTERYLYIPALGAGFLLALGFEKLGEALKGPLEGPQSRLPFFWLANLLFTALYTAGYLYIYRFVMWDMLPEVNSQVGPVFIASGLVIGALLGLVSIGWDRILDKKPISPVVEFIFFYLLLAAGFIAGMVLTSSLVYHRLVLPVPEVQTKYQAYLVWLHAHAKPGSTRFATMLPHGTNRIELFNFLLFVFTPGALLLVIINRFGRKMAGLKSELAAFLLFAPVFILALQSETKLRTRDWFSEVSLWKLTVRENPRVFPGWNNLGRAFVERKKYSNATDSFLMAHSVAPDQLEPIINLGNTMLMQQDLESAEHYYRWAVLMNEFNFTARLNLGNCLLLKNEFNLANEQYLEALRINPNLIEAAYNLAYSFYRMGDRAKAFLYWQKSLTAVPDHVPSRMLFRELMGGQPSRQ